MRRSLKGSCLKRLMTKIPKGNEPKIQELLWERKEGFCFVPSLPKHFCLDLRSLHLWNNPTGAGGGGIIRSCTLCTLFLPGTHLSATPPVASGYPFCDSFSHFLLFLLFQRLICWATLLWFMVDIIILAYFISFSI